jgi:hypothetical protein
MFYAFLAGHPSAGHGNGHNIGSDPPLKGQRPAVAAGYSKNGGVAESKQSSIRGRPALNGDAI